MIYVSLAKQNIKHNFRNYSLYLISAIIAVMVFHLFCSIFLSKEILTVAKENSNIANSIKISAVFVILFSSIFIWYSNSFFVKARKREIGLYALLGLRHREIGWMLFYENMALGSLAIVVGIIFGSLFAKLFAMLLVRMMGLETEVHSVVSLTSIGITVLVFAFIFIIASLHGMRIIYRNQLIELFKAEKKREDEPKASFIGAIFGIIGIMAAYVLLFLHMDNTLFNHLVYIVPLLIFSTFLFFRSSIVFILKSLRRRKPIFYNGANMVGITQILFRIKGNTLTLTAISLFSVVTLTSLGLAYSLYKTVDVSIRERCPFTFMYEYRDDSTKKKVEDAIQQQKGAMKTEIDLDLLFTQFTPEYDKTSIMDTYVINKAQYNTLIVNKQKGDQIRLKENDAVLLMSVADSASHDSWVNKEISLSENGNSKKGMTLTIVRQSTERIVNKTFYATTLVITDEAFSSLKSKENLKIRHIIGYRLNDDKKLLNLSHQIDKIIPQNAAFDSYPQIYQNSYQAFGMYMFIGVFIGILFLAATGSIIFYKQLMDANENKKRYRLLQKIGMSIQDIKRSVQRQMMLVFSLPLLVATAHSCVVLSQLARLVKQPLLSYSLIVISIYLAIYIFYYFLTVRSYLKIVVSNENPA